MATNPNTPLWEPRKKTGNYKPPENNFWRDLSQPWNYWRPTLSPPVYGYSYPFEAAGAYDFNIPLGYNTPPTYTPDLPATNIGEPTFYLGNATPPASTTGTLPPVMPTFPTYGPQPAVSGDIGTGGYAPSMTTGGGGTPGNPDYNYWHNLAQTKEQWTPEEQAAYLAQFYGQTDENGNLIYVGNPQFGDPYQVMPYWKYDGPTWVGGREGGQSSMGRGRMPGRYYIPKQEFYKTPGGRTYASRDGWEDAFGKDENPPGNNRNVSIPAWVGPLVSWRT